MISIPRGMIFGKRSQESQSPRTDQAFFLSKNNWLIIIKQHAIFKPSVNTNRQENNKEKKLWCRMLWCPWWKNCRWRSWSSATRPPPRLGKLLLSACQWSPRSSRTAAPGTTLSPPSSRVRNWPRLSLSGYGGAFSKTYLNLLPSASVVDPKLFFQD